VFTPEELAGTLFATSTCFDLSIFEVFVPWSVGGTVILAENVLSLSELPAAEQVTLINTVPSAMAELVRAGAVPASVLTVNLAGEPLPRSLASGLYEHTHVRNVYNLYGPTEAATYATFAPINRYADVTIGGPIANTQAYILDSYRKLVPRGVAGELYLGGDGLARGYLGRPDLTAERFVSNPFSKEAGARLYRTGDLCRHREDGRIEYLGRLDHQVKLRGFRIELGEIEAVLEQHDMVRQAIATVRESAEEKRLVSYVEAKPGRPLTLPELRRHAEQSLPLYMVPDTFVVLNEFPRTANGKVDRSALPAPDDPSRAAAVAPRTELEATLKHIWETVLGVRPIGLEDNFFDLGGHSLLAARLMAEVQDTVGKKIPLSAIFRAPTIEGFARLLADESIVKPDPTIMRLSAGDAGKPFFAVAAPGVDTFGLALLAHQMGKEQSVYKLQALAPVIGDRPFQKEELSDLAHEYIVAMRSVQPRGPYCLGGMCEGVLIGQQMILELEARGEEVELFTIFDTWVLENTQIRPLWAINYYRERLQGLWSSSMREQLAILWKTVRRWFSQSPPANGSGWKETYWPSEGFAAPRFKAPVLLFKRPRQPFYYIRDPQMGWGARSTGGVEICEINCGHTEVLREPYVRIIGQILATRLQGAKDREGERDSALPADKAINQWVRVSSLDDVGKAVKGR
jgi:thioesterase domain-containing protein/acyl carrier protein